MKCYVFHAVKGWNALFPQVFRPCSQAGERLMNQSQIRFAFACRTCRTWPGPGQSSLGEQFVPREKFAWPRSQSFSNLWHISIISIISTWTFRTVLKIKTTTWTWILLSNPRWQGSVRAILLPQQIPCRFSTVDLMHGALEEHQDLKNESWKALHSIQCLTA